MDGPAVDQGVVIRLLNFLYDFLRIKVGRGIRQRVPNLTTSPIRSNAFSPGLKTILTSDT